ncbi:MAG: hypothetical protein AAGI48_02200 [Verrucomicrobiota bacterium]
MRAFLFGAVVVLGSLVQAEEVRDVECRFLCFGAARGASAMAVSDGGGEVKVPLYSNRLSKPVVCQAKGGEISFVSGEDREPMAVATVPEGVEQAVMIFHKAMPVVDEEESGEQPDEVWKVCVIGLSKENFPNGGACIANVTGSSARYDIGEHEGTIEVGKFASIAAPEERNDFNQVPVIVETQAGDKWQKISETPVRFVEGMQFLITVDQAAKSGRKAIHQYKLFLGR